MAEFSVMIGKCFLDGQHGGLGCHPLNVGYSNIKSIDKILFIILLIADVVIHQEARKKME